MGSFHSERAHLIKSIGREATRVVETYDHRREAETIAEHARVAVTTAAAAGGAAVGLGTLVTLAASTAAADITGILMASLVAALGFLIIPARRRKALLRPPLARALRTEFEQAQARGSERLEKAVDPYRRFVRSEQSRWADAGKTLASLGGRAAAFRDRLAA